MSSSPEISCRLAWNRDTLISCSATPTNKNCLDNKICLSVCYKIFKKQNYCIILQYKQPDKTSLWLYRAQGRMTWGCRETVQYNRTKVLRALSTEKHMLTGMKLVSQGAILWCNVITSYCSWQLPAICPWQRETDMQWRHWNILIGLQKNFLKLRQNPLFSTASLLNLK